MSKSNLDKSPTPFNLRISAQTIWSVILIIFVGILIYSNTWRAGFHLDDESSIMKNPTIMDITRVDQIWKFYKFRFLTYLSFALNYYISGFDRVGFHLFNIGTHIAASLCAYFLTAMIFMTPKMQSHSLVKHGGRAALFVALIFLCHPIQTQAVTYIVQRLAVMSGLFYLATLLFYLKARLENKNKYFVLAWFFMVAAFYSKENSYTLPIMVGLLEFVLFENKKAILKRIALLLPFCLPWLIVYLTIYRAPLEFTDQQNFMRLAEENLPRHHYLFTQFNVICTYIRLLFFPIGQNLDYDYAISKTLFEFPTMASFLLLVGVMGIGVILFKQQRLVFLGIAWFFISLSVESSIIPIRDVIFEHRLYLPLYGFALCLVLCIYKFFNSIRDWKVACGIIILVFSLLTFSRNFIWQTERSLWADVVKKSPNKARPWINLGNAYGRLEDHKTAEKHFRKAIEVQPDYAPAYNALGAKYKNTSECDTAIEYYKKAIELDLGYGDAFYNMGLCYVAKEQYELAIESYLKAIHLRPNSAGYYDSLGAAYGFQRKYDLAIKNFEKAIEIDPKATPPLKNLGVAYIKKGDVEQALAVIAKLKEMGGLADAEELTKGLHDGDDGVKKIISYENGEVVSVQEV